MLSKSNPLSRYKTNSSKNKNDSIFSIIVWINSLHEGICFLTTAAIFSLTSFPLLRRKEGIESFLNHLRNHIKI